MAIHDGCYRITLMWGAQTGKSQVQLMSMGYFIDHDPQSIMHMQPSQGDLQTWLSAKFDPMVDSTPSLSNKIAAPRGREGVNNQKMKQYPGGFLMFAWSGSPKTMRGRSAPKIYPDETDGYERTSEGHPIGLIWQRAATFGDQRLLFETSTPTIKNASHIESGFEEGDQRRWHVKCPDCDEEQYFKWSQVNWQKGPNKEHLPETAQYVCEHCGSLWDDAKRFQAIRQGRWIAEKPFNGHASYHLPEMASMFRRLSDIVKSFLEKKAVGDLQTFVNVSLAETWEEEGDSIEHSSLHQRREHYPDDVPEKACVLTAAVDVQDDRLEIGVEAWGEGEENWKVDFTILRGDPARNELWQKLDDVLSEKYTHETGVKLPIACTTIDSGGHYTQQVYKFCKQREGRRVYAIKGRGGEGTPIVSRPSKSNLGKVSLFTVGVDTAKETVYARLKVNNPGPGYVHFPVREYFDEEYFEQLTAEKRVVRYVKGHPKREWIKKRSRNEALDIAVYNMAALYILNPNFKRLSLRLHEKPEEKPEPKQRRTTQRPIRKRPRKKNWATDI